ncbi:hydroxyphenylacetyl-CoA thioesterase PaaI [Nocardioides lentus]|uniref:Hydroxyphenylacetyl-CoA thioesterase PaaI n=1 Tax=Nocardioides lentus TaxID=338077 RepID=A0ABN2PWE6_9ACTN
MPEAPAGAGDAQALAERCTHEMLSGDASRRLLDIELLLVSPGRARLAMTVRGDMVNGWGLCQGGLVSTLADSAFAVACNTHGEVTVAAGFDVSFLESGRLGDRLVADAREVARRGRSGIYDVTVTRSADEAVLAEFRGRSRATGRPNPAA